MNQLKLSKLILSAPLWLTLLLPTVLCGQTSPRPQEPSIQAQTKEDPYPNAFNYFGDECFNFQGSSFVNWRLVLIQEVQRTQLYKSPLELTEDQTKQLMEILQEQAETSTGEAELEIDLVNTTDMRGAKFYGWNRSRPRLKTAELEPMVLNQSQEIRELLKEILDERQLEKLYQIGSSKLLEKGDLSGPFRTLVDEDKIKLTDEKAEALNQKRMEIIEELYMKRTEIRAKAWQKIMKAMPPAHREAMEKHLMIDGLVK